MVRYRTFQLRFARSRAAFAARHDQPVRSRVEEHANLLAADRDGPEVLDRVRVVLPGPELEEGHPPAEERALSTVRSPRLPQMRAYTYP